MSVFTLLLYANLILSFNALATEKELPSNIINQPTPIKLGMSITLSGPTSNLGKNLKAGASIYFRRLNADGGINGNSVELISLDDGYEPQNTVINTKIFIEQQVLALFGYVGTPTSHVILPLLEQSQIPYLMPFTGADFLRTPSNRKIFNLRASYYQEVEAQIEYLINIKQFKKIALVIQADEFGLSAQRAVNKIFSDYELKITTTARYRRNSDDIKHALAKISAKPIDAVIFVGTYQPLIRLIKLSHQQGLDLLFTSLSFIGSHNVFNNLPKSSRLLLSEVVPDPTQCKWALCQRFRDDMSNAGYDEQNRVQFEGYLNAFVFSQVAKQCKEHINRECLINKFEQFTYQDKQLKIDFRNKSRQGLQQIYFSFSKAIQSPLLSPSSTHRPGFKNSGTDH